MQGVHVAPAFNDENSTIGPLLHTAFKESTSLQAPAKQGSALKSARKAFGNITNTRTDAAQQQHAGTAVKRRAFGDITNSTIKQQPGAASTKKGDPYSSQVKPSSTKAPLAPAAGTAEAAVLPAPWWETAAPEKPAGKTWEQLLADREQQEDADVERSVQQLLAGFRDLTARCFQMQPDDSSDDEEVQLLGPPPPPLPTTSSSRSSNSMAVTSNGSMQQPAASTDVPFGLQSSSGCIADLLPEVELPSADLYDYNAAEVAVPTWPVGLPQKGQAPVASLSAAHSCSTSGSWSAAEASCRPGPEAQEQMLQQMASSMGHSPSRSSGGSVDAVVGLKSPEALPW